ncbi:hypothetical protein CsSME_00041796 [Camellia sinensis var. sinensis]
MKTLSLIDVSAIDDGFWLLQETSQSLTMPDESDMTTNLWLGVSSTKIRTWGLCCRAPL